MHKQMEKIYRTEDFFERMEPWMQEQVWVIRELILSHSGVLESMKYGVPFYTINGLLMYITSIKKKGLVLGFCQGAYLPDPAGLLRADEGQTLIRHWVFQKDKEPDWELLAQYIETAVNYNCTGAGKTWSNPAKKKKA